MVYDSRAPEGSGIGLYMEMKAEMLTSRRDVVRARKIYTTNFGENQLHEPFTGECPRRLYRARALKAWHNSDSSVEGNFIDVRREISLN